MSYTGVTRQGRMALTGNAQHVKNNLKRADVVSVRDVLWGDSFSIATINYYRLSIGTACLPQPTGVHLLANVMTVHYFVNSTASHVSVAYCDSQYF